MNDKLKIVNKIIKIIKEHGIKKYYHSFSYKRLRI